MYVDFVEDVVPLVLKLSESFGLKTGSYYGHGLSGHNKDEVLQSWRNGVIQVMVATTAFGLGVNQQDVKTIVRIGVPPTMEELVQEFGGAGRDGRKAKGKSISSHCYIFGRGGARLPKFTHTCMAAVVYVQPLTTFLPVLVWHVAVCRSLAV